MKIGCLICGLLILANPNIGIIDFLPDFIGYLLIIRALRSAHILVPYWNDAIKGASKMMAISIVKLLCTPLIFKNIASLPLLLSFSFALIELIFLLPTINKLFEGLFYTGTRYDIPSVFSHYTSSKTSNETTNMSERGERRNDELGPKVKRATIAFLIFRSVASILPTLSDLQLFEHSGEVTDTYVIRFSDFNNLFAIAAFAVGLIGSIIWISSFLPYAIRLSKDSAWRDLTGICERLEKSPEFADKLAIRREFVFLILSVCTSVFVLIDGVNYLLGAIPAFFLVITALLHGKYNRVACFAPLPAVICAVTSIIELSGRYNFFIDSTYKVESALWLPRAEKIYFDFAPFNILDRLFLLVALMIVFCPIFRKWDGDFTNTLNSKAVDIYEKERHISLRRRFKILWGLSVPLFVLTALEPYLVLQIDFISVLLALVSIVWAFFTVMILLDMMKERYSLEIDESIIKNDQ